jgi:hypothetical protein
MEQRLFDLLARDGVWLLFAAQVFGIFGLPIPDELLRNGDASAEGSDCDADRRAR